MTQRVRIAFLSAYSGPVKRGVESWVHEIASRLASLDYEVRVYQLGEKHDEMYDIQSVAIPVDWTHSDETTTDLRSRDMDYWSLMLKRFTLALVPDLTAFSPDIVIPLNGSWENPLIKKYCEANSAKMVLVGHWDDVKGLECQPDLYVATSEKQKEWAQLHFNGKIEFIPNAVDITKFTPKGDVYPLSLPAPRILTVGALTPDKGIERTIRAVSNIPQASLVVCGDGNEKDGVKRMGKELLSDRFVQLQLDYADMPKLYRACSLFTLVPSATEAFGNVYIEAMASGLGVVARDDQIRRDIVGEAGLFVSDSATDEEYAQVMIQALQTDFGDTPRSQAAKFSWDEIIKRYDTCFKECL